MFVFVAGFRFPTFCTLSLHYITLSKRFYVSAINMAAGICPGNIKICNLLLL